MTSKMKLAPKTIDEYLAAVSADKRAVLEKLRRTIRAAAPKAEECITYGIAAFRLHGKAIAGFGAATNHCTFFPMDGRTVENYKAELKDYDTSKGAIRFSVDKPLPATLVRKLVKARIADVTAPRKETGRTKGRRK